MVNWIFNIRWGLQIFLFIIVVKNKTSSNVPRNSYEPNHTALVHNGLCPTLRIQAHHLELSPMGKWRMSLRHNVHTNPNISGCTHIHLHTLGCACKNACTNTVLWYNHTFTCIRWYTYCTATKICTQMHSHTSGSAHTQSNTHTSMDISIYT